MANIYVRKSGSDSNDGSTPALAKLTIASAISAMTSGDTIYVGSGVYKDYDIYAGNKSYNIIGDTTGEFTGDAGEVIWSGMNSDDTDFNNVQYNPIRNNGGCNQHIENIIFENWKMSYYIFLGSLSGVDGTTIFKNIKIKNIFAIKDGGTSIYLIWTGRYGCTIEDILIDGVFAYSNVSTNIVAVTTNERYDSTVRNVKNIKISNLTAISYGNSGQSSVWGADLGGGNGLNAENIDVENLTAFSYYESNVRGVRSGDGSVLNNISVRNLYSNSLNRVATTYGIERGTINNSSVFNINANQYSGTPVVEKYHYVTNINNPIDKADYTIPKISPISKYSPLRGQGYTEFPTTDIEGNPRPAYGNGTACDIGASEATSEVVQRESVIKDAGDYSAKVAPCNYFKRQFQIPVTAGKLRTVKVKIRIDGTWGTYLPRVSLSGQGMTLSQTTKNSTTGSFEELTVSGTPSTTGIALLTVEAHSANTDAIMYLDTITLS